jgi:hypothetical protein
MDRDEGTPPWSRVLPEPKSVRGFRTPLNVHSQAPNGEVSQDQPGATGTTNYFQ